MPTDRTIPADGYASEARYWARCLDLSQKVAVYFPSVPGTVDLVGYYDTVSEALTAATAATNADGFKPLVAINWCHPDVVHLHRFHRDAREDLPAWIDAEVA